MYKICKTEESAARQRNLEQLLLEAMAQQSYSKISISDLCRRMNIPRKTFYRYFPTRDDALLSLIDHTLSQGNFFVFSKWAGGSSLTLQDLENFFEFWQSQHSFLAAIIANDLWPLLIQRTTVIVNQMKASQSGGTGYAREQVEYFIAYGLMLTAIRWHSHGYPSSPREMAQAICGQLIPSEVSIAKLFL